MYRVLRSMNILNNNLLQEESLVSHLKMGVIDAGLFFEHTVITEENKY